jgi:alpha-2-macroglobulin
MESDFKLYPIRKISKKMNIISPNFKVLFVILTLTICFNTNGQKLIESRQTSFYTYIYKITDKEARKIYKNDIWKVDTTFFHTLVDSFPTDSQYFGKLTHGHYIKTYAEQNKQKLAITTVQDFDVFIINNNTDLCVQVYDLSGKIIPDAELKIRQKKLRFNKKTQSYLDKKSNQKGLLKATFNGFTAYYNLSRQYNNSSIKRGTRQVIYGTPIKYAWIPVNFIIYIPIDGVKSIAQGYPRGTINKAKNFFVKSFENIACNFDDYYCNYNTDYKFTNKHTGYIVFNKPKYMPGDTVKFKAYLLSKKGKPVNKQVNVILQANRKNIELTQLSPYNKGGYAYEFFLHDSLQLQLDRRYIVYLKLNDRKEYISGSFEYEDYELSKNTLSLRLEETEQFKNQKIKLFAKGTDENDLNLLDARIEILVSPKSINQYFEKHAFIPDTIFFLEKKLEPTDETEILLSDSTFPKINFDYNINVRLLTSDNQVISENKQVNYYYNLEEFEIELLTDSIQFNFKVNGSPKLEKVTVIAKDNFGNETPVYNGNTPCMVELNPYYSSYTIKSDSLSETLDISDESSLLQCLSERTKDSVFIVVDNPRKIPFNYNIYKKNSRKSAGYSDSLSLRQKSSSKQNYFVSIRYLWGGQIKVDNYRIPLVDKQLNISVTQPKIVYPGQKSQIEILVTNTEGNPVEGVDLTAYSMTKKFGYSPPNLPYLGKSKKNKSVVNNFNFKEFNLSAHTGLNLDYDAWKILSGLDSIEYYKFIYPENSIYSFEYQTYDTLTQFAPFVVSDGAVQPIHVIYVDSKPVYFSWSTHTQPYSFKIDSGFHQIKLRTNYRNIIIDSICFNQGKKLIFSLNEDFEFENVKSSKAEPKLSDSEKRLLYRYIFPYRNNSGEQYAYIEQDENIQFLKPAAETQLYNNYWRRQQNFAGPLVGNLTYHLLDSFSTNFNHEPFFEYDFSPAILKMRSIDSKKYPEQLSIYQPETELTDVLITKEVLNKQWKNYLDSKRYLTARYLYPSSTSEGAGRLLLNFTRHEYLIQDIPLNILVFRYDNHEFLRVYPGNTSLIHELQKGYHKLIFFYSGAKYHIVDSVYIEPNGLNYYEYNQPQVFKKDTFSLYVSNIIEETLFKPNPYYNDEEKELKQIYNLYQQQFKYTGVGDMVEGYVNDAESGEALPGVNVVVKGTTYGTVTNLDGYYSIKVPAGNNILNFSYIGYISEDKAIGYNNIVNANLTTDIENLEEVVVVGYGTVKKSMLTGSISTVTSQSLLGGMPGVSGNISQALQGRVAGVMITTKSGSPGSGVEITIRGASTIEFDKTPLYIINGNVYTGDIADLDPAIIQNIEILKDASATAIYGSRGSNGVVIIETQSGAFKPTKAQTNKGADFDDTFFEAASQSSSIRENFSDYAFWKPSLITDEEGKASFDITFPDDVTSWETYYLAMNGKRQSGQAESLIKSYKPLMAKLAVPRFLVQTDTTYAIGKVLNYSTDSIKVTTKFEINNKKQYANTRYCTHSVIDTLAIIAEADSLSIKYFLEKEDGYFDGELREIPVFPIGLEETTGNFWVLDADTTLKLTFDSTLGVVNLYARADILDVIEDEISHLIKYKYSCNEQLASKLKALIAEKNIAYYKGEKFKNDSEIEKLIRLLRKNQKENGLWGWWKDSEESEWISLHVLEAITHAEQLGFDTKINKGSIIENLIWELENSRVFYSRIRILKILNLLGAQIGYQPYIADLEKTKKLSLNGILQIIELKQLCNIDYDTDTLDYYKKTTLVGNIYFTEEIQESNLLFNEIQNTLLAYRILQADSINDNVTLSKIRNYFLENRKNGYWRNTYESAQIIETILPDLLGDKTDLTKPTLTIQGDIDKSISEFPFEMVVNPNQQIEISKSGDFPIYFTSYQTFWNSSPILKKEDFEIVTKFDSESSSTLTAGQETKLIVYVIVNKDAEYVMINVPIPGGCSYADKKNNFRNESHREYFKNETAIFCEYLSKGEYAFEIELIPRYSGTYTLNPAKIELMYFPTFNANNEIKRVKIK